MPKRIPIDVAEVRRLWAAGRLIADRTERRLAGLTQAQIAERFGVNETLIHQIVTGERRDDHQHCRHRHHEPRGVAVKSPVCEACGQCLQFDTDCNGIAVEWCGNRRCPNGRRGRPVFDILYARLQKMTATGRVAR